MVKSDLQDPTMPIQKVNNTEENLNNSQQTDQCNTEQSQQAINEEQELRKLMTPDIAKKILKQNKCIKY